MTVLRPYQQESIDGLFEWWADKPGNALLVLPTGTGKSVVLAEVSRLCLGWDGTRVLIVTHVQELVEQNYLELIRLWPQAPAGINAAGLNRRDTKADITFCSIQSVWKHATKFQKIDIVMVDEAHLIPVKNQTMYRRFLDDLWVMNPYMKVVGFTATPFRLGSGRLDEGEGALFSGIAYEYPIREAIDEGYLCSLTTKHTTAQFDLSDVKVVGGEYVAGQLEAAVDRAELNQIVVDEVIARAGNRKSWLFFCSGVDHAQHISEILNERGISCAVIHAETPKQDRKNIIREFKAGKLQAIASMNVITTGFNAPSVDLIAMLRPTKSAGLYIQMAGRGTRPLYAPGMPLDSVEQRLAAIEASVKPDCLVLDFAGNIERFGPIDQINVRKPKKGDPGEAPTKTCPECEEVVLAAARQCPCCGYGFPEPQPKFQQRPTAAPILSTNVPEWVPVKDVFFQPHTKAGKPTSMKVTYQCGFQEHREWICFEHEGFARGKAAQWWRKLKGQDPVPDTVADAIRRTNELDWPGEILVKPDGQYTSVVGLRGVLTSGPVRDLYATDEGIPF